MTQSNPHRLSAAYQQAGYAVMHSVIEGNSDRIVTVTIAPSQRALGYTQFRPKDEQRTPTADEIKQEGLIAMAGLVALQELGTENPTTSCSVGLIRAHQIAERYVFVTEGPGPDRGPKITEVLDAWKAECTALVAANKDKIAKVRDALLERDTLTADDVTALLG